MQLTASASPTILTVVAKLSKDNQFKSFENDQNRPVSQLRQLFHRCIYLSKRQLIHFKGVQFIKWKLYLNKVTFFKNSGTQSTDGWANKRWLTHTTEYYPALKWGAILTHVTSGWTLRTLLSEISQSQDCHRTNTVKLHLS